MEPISKCVACLTSPPGEEFTQLLIDDVYYLVHSECLPLIKGDKPVDPYFMVAIADHRPQLHMTVGFHSIKKSLVLDVTSSVYSAKDFTNFFTIFPKTGKVLLSSNWDETRKVIEAAKCYSPMAVGVGIDKKASVLNKLGSDVKARMILMENRA